MTLYANDRDVLETLLYRRLQTLWHDCTDALSIFSKHSAGTELCGQKVWEALLTAFPLNHQRMQTVLLATEFGNLMALLEDRCLLDATGSRHTTQPAHAGVVGHHTSAHCSLQTRVPAPSVLGPYADAAGAGQPMLSIALNPAPSSPRFTNPYS
jgi:hypothetical protein